MNTEIKQWIEANKDVLLASFGLEALIKSDVKPKLIKEFVMLQSKKHGDKLDNVLDVFFKQLQSAYIGDKVINKRPLDEIARFVAEEKTWTVYELMKEV